MGPQRSTATSTLSQEFEIAGQRGRRLAMLDAEAAVSCAAWPRWNKRRWQLRCPPRRGAVDARRAGLAEQAVEVAAALGRFSSARAAQELLPQVESDLARAEAARLSLLRAEVALRGRNAGALLSALLQSPQGLAAGGGELAPPPQAQDRLMRSCRC